MWPRLANGETISVGMRVAGPQRSPQPEPGRRRHVIPEPAVLVVGDDHDHARPLRPAPQPLENIGDVGVAAQQVRVGGMLIEAPGGLVEHHRRQAAGVDVAQEVLAVLQMQLAILRARRKPAEIVEGLMVRLEIEGVVRRACR